MQEPISNAFPFSSKPGLMGPKARTITDSKSVLSLFSTDPPSRLGQIRERTDLGSVIVRVFGPIRPGFDENGNAFDIGSCKYAIRPGQRISTKTETHLILVPVFVRTIRNGLSKRPARAHALTKY